MKSNQEINLALLSKKNDLEEKKESKENKFICSITQETLQAPVLTSCGHYFSSSREVLSLSKCPLCRAPLQSNNFVRDDFLDQFLKHKNQFEKREEKYQTWIKLIDSNQLRKERYTLLNKCNEKLNQLNKPDILYLCSLSEPAIASCEHFVEKYMPYCEQCDRTHSQTDLFDANVNLKSALSEFKKYRESIFLESNLEDVFAEKNLAKNMQNKILQYLARITYEKNDYHTNLTEFIWTKKEDLKLNIYDVTHLQYWHERTNHGCHGYGGMAVSYDGNQFRIPSRIYEMMRVADKQSYHSRAVFLQAFETAQKTKPGLFNKVFSCFMTRHPETANLYMSDIEFHRVSDDVESLQLIR